MKIKNILYIISPLFALFSSIADAHVSLQSLTWKNGLMHPLTGLDHFLTMFGIGLLSYYISDTKKNVYELLKMPIVFCGCLLLSFIFQFGEFLNSAYLTPATLILTLGLMMIKTNSKYLVWMILPLVAIVHGHIHSTDILSISLSWPYAVSFVFTTFFLHLFGIKLAEISNRLYISSNKLVGSIFMLLGVYLMV